MVVENEPHNWTLNPLCSIYTVELYAIWQAMLYFSLQGHDTCLICTDSLSAINTLEDPFTLNVWAIKILEINTNLTSTNEMVTIMWVPSHTNITGNELADSAAKDATTNICETEIHRSMAKPLE
ncbi:hypothetical protein JTB14_017501 [Gonioctena quinquepunctata]|nr:hypothetical protein JTB14_017501 [Gonioctena quinquepunctata]